MDEIYLLDIMHKHPDVEYIEYTEEPSPQLNICAPRLLQNLYNLTRLPKPIIENILQLVLYPEDLRVNSICRLRFWSEKAIASFRSNKFIDPTISVLNAALEVPMHLYEKHGLPVFTQTSYNYDLNDHEKCYRHYYADSVWESRNESYYRANETIVLLS
jgi:hypothetical protein